MPEDDLEARVAALEQRTQELADQVRESRQDAAAARILAGGVDREVGELQSEFRDFRQAMTASLNALRADAVDLRAHVDERFDQVNEGFIEMRGRLDASAAGQQMIAEMIQSLIDKP